MLLDALKWVAPHGLARRRAQRASAATAEEFCGRLHAMYRQLVPAGSVAFDVGANVGNRIEPLLRCGARVVAVEPQPDCAEVLQRAFQGRITIVRAAAGRAKGVLPLHVSDSRDTVATLSEEFIASAKASNRFGPRDWGRTIDVPVETLDSLIASHGEPSFIKIDVEGFELEVLRGLSRAVDALSFEWTSNMPAAVVACIDRCEELGMAHFQYSFGESAVFSHARSITAAEARQLARLLGEEQRLFGDIYATRRPLVRA